MEFLTQINLKAACINSCSDREIPILLAISFHCFTELNTSFNILLISDWFNLKKSLTLLANSKSNELLSISIFKAKPSLSMEGFKS